MTARPKQPTEQQVLEIVKKRNPTEYPVVTAADVHELADYDVTKRTIANRLEELVEAGELRSRKAGRTMIYWREEDILSGNESDSASDVSSEGGADGERNKVPQMKGDGGGYFLERLVSSLGALSLFIMAGFGFGFAWNAGEQGALIFRAITMFSGLIFILTLIITGFGIDRWIGRHVHRLAGSYV